MFAMVVFRGRFRGADVKGRQITGHPAGEPAARLSVVGKPRWMTGAVAASDIRARR